jgi:type 1 fimbriae regulatory protein FimB/type 1 fimbriae regulatory protein FimE
MGKSPPRRVLNSERRSREYLSPAEVDAMICAAKTAGRYGHRDATLILLTYRHAGRVSEVIAWRRDQVDLVQGVLHVNRLKNGTPSVHPLRGPEIRALRKLFRDYPDSPYVFSSERKGPLTAAAVRKIVSRAGELADIGFPVHPHMLRHATGYYLASKGQDTRAIQAYMGHKNIQHTVRYTELSPERFKDFWRD